ncbi:hypothetical protein ABZ614_34650 [Streptomyces sp. NPDC013178]|uniref:hypothetical protein n=1 Tax=Streptomyces sp. NPDC013178 TaxID=3155118 RepID=UPI0033D02E78
MGRGANRWATSRARAWGEGEALVPVGRHLTHHRRKGGFDKDPDRAKTRAAQLTAITPNWSGLFCGC